MVDGNGGLPQQRTDHRDLHPGPQEHRLVFASCVEEAKVLSGDDVVGRHAEEEDWTDKREGEGEEARAGEEQEGPHVTVAKTDVVVLPVSCRFKELRCE